jgi:hypothetical protein
LCALDVIWLIKLACCLLSTLKVTVSKYWEEIQMIVTMVRDETRIFEVFLTRIECLSRVVDILMLVFWPAPARLVRKRVIVRHGNY